MFTALKPCTISGKKYLIDDEVDVSMLTDKEIAHLLKRKFIIETKGEGGDIAPSLLAVPIINEDETLTLEMTGEQVVECLGILQLTADDAIEAIKGIEDEAKLILIHRIDSRKTVKEAAKKRAEALNADNSDTDNGDA